MYLEHFGLNEAPFRITPHTDFFFEGGNRGATLDALLYAITHDEGIVKVSGEVGSGKTMLCRVLMERLPEKVTIIYLANPSLSREDILYAITDELHLSLPKDARAAMVLRALQDHLIHSYSEGRQVVVLIDEAHAMPAETLEEIRLLSNLESNRNKLLQLVLFGQPELNDVLARPDMRQLKERITHNFNLEPLVRDDITSYLDFRMRAAGYKGPRVFGEQAVQGIAKVSQGLTRRVNILADKCLLAAYSSGGHQIGTAEVRAAIKDSDFSKATLSKPNLLTATHVRTLAALITATIVGAGLATYYHGKATQLGDASVAQTIPSSRQLEGTIAGTVAGNSAPATEKRAAEVDLPLPAAVATATEPTPASPIGTAVPVPAPNPPASPLQVQVAHEKVAETRPAPPTQAAAEPTSASHESEPNLSLGPLTVAGIELGKKWLTSAPPDRWFLQLLLSNGDRPRAVEYFLLSAKSAGMDMTKIRVYLADINGTRRFGVVYGDFESRTMASGEIRELPRSQRVGKPYPRQVSQLR